MVTLFDIYFALLVALVIWFFAYQRKQAEIARSSALKYCEQQGLQFISIARTSNVPKFNKRLGLHWYSTFNFEFSGDGESSYQGELIMAGKKIKTINLPAYKI